MPFDSFRDFLNTLDKAGELKRISQPVATELEITEIADREMKSPGGGKALLFEKPSLRTRVSFELAMRKMGGHCLYLSPAEVGLGQRESVQDVALVLSRFVDVIAARTFLHGTVEALAKYGSVPVVNALTDEEHPCQAIADVLTVLQRHPSVRGLTMTYIGDGNNCAISLLYAWALLGGHYRIASPAGYELPATVVEQANRMCAATGPRTNPLPNDEPI